MHFWTQRGTWRPLLAVICILTLVPASAQILAPILAPTADSSDESEQAPDANDPDLLRDIDVDKLNWSQLNVDAGTLQDIIAAKRRAATSADSGLSWSSNLRSNGISGVGVKQPVSSFWDTQVGADMTVAREPATMSELLAEKAANGGNLPQSSGTAWARAKAPGAGAIWDSTAVEARIDPGAENSKLGASLTKSVPLSEETSLTLQNGYSINQQGTTALPGIAGRTSRSYETEQSAKVTLTDTGTTFVAGQSMTTNEDRWQRRIGAEQKLFDNVTVSGSVSETAQGSTSKSLSAGYKRSW
jgi:hypothetical protein